MEIILLSDVARLGAAGQKANVKDGYAHNFLFPRGLAVPATAGSAHEQQQRQRAQLRALQAQKERALALARQLEAARCTIAAAVGEQGKLHGAVTAADIVEALRQQGIELDRHQIEMERPLTGLGEFPVPVRLQADVRASVRVTIVPQ